MSEEWKTLTDAQKVQYQALSDKAKERYMKEMHNYKEKLAKAVGAEASDKVESIVGKKRPAASPKAKPVKAAAKKAVVAEVKKVPQAKRAAPKARGIKKVAAVAGEQINAEEEKHEVAVESSKKITPQQHHQVADAHPVHVHHEQNGEVE